MAALTSCLAWAQIQVDLSTKDRTWGSAEFGNAMDGVYRRRNHDATQRFRAVQCSESGELTGSNGKFAVRAGCGDLKWQFKLSPYPVEGAVASRQSSWFSSAHSWWLVSEGTAMLHPPGEGQSRRISFLVDGEPLEIHAGPRQLPELHHAPGFWLLGKPAFIDKGQVRHFFDRGAVPQHLVELLDSHQAGMAYLQAELPRADVPPVFWMGLTDWQSAAGGAMGTGLVLANYPVIADEFDNTAYAFTLYIVLHEHSHGLFGGTGSLWINESLASYLAIKAIGNTSPEHYPLLADAFIEPGNALGAPLPVIGERAAAGDGQAYSQLYMGAAFWTAIDSAMIKQGSLLPVLPEILARGFTPDGMPRRNEIAELTGLTAETLNRVLDPFFGTE